MFLVASGGGGIKSSLELSLGSSDLGGVLNGSRGNTSVHRGNQCGGLGDGRGHGQVGGRKDPEAGGIGNILHLLGKAVGINVGVGADGTTIGGPALLLGRVDVGIAVVDIAIEVLGLVLGSRSNGNNSLGSIGGGKAVGGSGAVGVVVGIADVLDDRGGGGVTVARDGGGGDGSGGDGSSVGRADAVSANEAGSAVAVAKTGQAGAGRGSEEKDGELKKINK